MILLRCYSEEFILLNAVAHAESQSKELAISAYSAWSPFVEFVSDVSLPHSLFRDFWLACSIFARTEVKLKAEHVEQNTGIAGQPPLVEPITPAVVAQMENKPSFVKVETTKGGGGCSYIH